MSERATTQASKTTTAASQATAQRTPQRTCACGQPTVDGVECAACRRKRLGLLQRAAVQSGPVGGVPARVYDVLRSPGQPLNAATRAALEPRFGHDFSGVRIHSDAPAAESARAVRARAYTVGQDVVFGAGEYAPHTPGGQHLLAHELSHVVQQAGAAPPDVLGIAPADSPFEHEAWRAADALARPAGAVPVALRAPAQLARAGEEKALAEQGSVDVIQLLPDLDQVKLYTSRGVITYRLTLNRLAPGDYIAGVDVTQETKKTRQGEQTYSRVVLSLQKVIVTSASDRIRFYFSYDVKPDQPNPADLLRNQKTVRVVVGGPLAARQQQPIEVGAGQDVTQTPTPPARTPGAGEVRGGTQDDKTGQRETGPPRQGEKAPAPRFGSGIPGGTGEPANAPALDANIEGLATQPLGGIGTYTMRLDYNLPYESAVGRVVEAANAVYYHWEVYDITGAIQQSVPKSQAPTEEKTEAEKQKEALDQVRRKALLEKDTAEARKIGTTDAARRQFGITTEQIAKEQQAAREDVAQAAKNKNIGDLLIGLANLEPRLTAISGVVRLAGDALGGLADAFGGYRQERGIPWSRQGIFAIRCVAQPQPQTSRDGSVLRRAASVAVKSIEVKPVVEIAKDEIQNLQTEDAKLALLKALLERETDPVQQEKLRKEIAEQELRTTAPALDVLEKARSKKVVERDAARAAGNIYKARDIGYEIDDLDKQIALARRLKGSGRIYRPRATLVSEITGQTYPLLLQLQLTPPAVAGQPYAAQISDVTTKDGGLYRGTGADPTAAAWAAFDDMRGHNDYGPGTLAVLLPEKAPDDTIEFTQREKTLPNTARGGTAVIKKLEDLGKVLALLALAVPGVGEAALVVGAGVAAAHLITRWQEGRLYLDAATIGDVISVLSAAAVGVGALGKLAVVREGSQFRIAVTEGAAVTRAAGTAAEALNYGGLIVGSAQILDALMTINKDELAGKITHAQARRQRASLIANAVQTGAIFIAGEARKARGAGERRPPSKEETDAVQASKKPPATAGEQDQVPGKAGTGAQAPGERAAAPTERAPVQTVEQELAQLGKVNSETQDILRNNAPLRRALVENELAASALKKCASPCFPKEATRAQIERLENVLRRIAETGAYDEQLLKRYLAERRGNLDEAIRNIAGVENAGDLNAWLKFFVEGGQITKLPSRGSPEEIAARTERAHDIGVERGRNKAATDDQLQRVPWESPFAGKYGQGFDDIMVRGGNLDTGEVFIVEHKGGASRLAKGQMELDWVIGNIRRLYVEGGPADQQLARQLARALREGRLKGVAYSTPIKNNVPQETTTIGRWDYGKVPISLGP